MFASPVGLWLDGAGGAARENGQGRGENRKIRRARRFAEVRQRPPIADWETGIWEIDGPGAALLEEAQKAQQEPQAQISLLVELQYYETSVSAIQQRHKYYQEIPESTTTPLPILSTSSISMNILHLSDLHFGTLAQANRWSSELADDLRLELGISHLDALILSGDIANKSTPEEYAAAEFFLNEIRKDFPLSSEQIVIVPGNHDLNWIISEDDAYKPVLRKKYQGPVDEFHVIDDGSQYLAVLDEKECQRRFEHFSNFYQAIKATPYPLEYQQQYTLETIGTLLILGLNSAWQLDHHYKNRAHINTDALSNALKEISRNEAYKNCPLKMTVWHHPLNSPYEDRIRDQGFMEQLAKAGFCLFLHGHIHKAETSLYRYDMSPNGRKLDGICAGTFGAPTRELMPGYPWQYNLLKFEDNQLIVKTRRREEASGAWKPDARWLQGPGEQNPLPYYEIKLKSVTQAVKIQQPTERDSFLSLLKWIYEKSYSLEKLQPAHAKKILEIIRNVRQSTGNSIDFTDFEVKVMDLVFNYCHYFSLGGKARSSELEKLKKAEDYYHYLRIMVASKEKIRVGSVKLSSLVGDTKMSKVVEQLEEKSEF